MIEITNVLKKLSKKRLVFHSEADFQHALAWIIHEKYSGFNIRLEKRIILKNKEVYFDIFAFNDNKAVVIEVKYKTEKFDTKVKNEEFNLKAQGAQDQGRYDFIKDISRLEEALKTGCGDAGFAIFLTNDEHYWKASTRYLDTADKAFRIHDGKTIKDKLSWKQGTSAGTMRGRAEPIILEGEYILNWKDYSNLEEQKGKFRYLLVEVNMATSYNKAGNGRKQSACG